VWTRAMGEGSWIRAPGCWARPLITLYRGRRDLGTLFQATGFAPDQENASLQQNQRGAWLCPGYLHWELHGFTETEHLTKGPQTPKSTVGHPLSAAILCGTQYFPDPSKSRRTEEMEGKSQASCTGRCWFSSLCSAAESPLAACSWAGGGLQIG
jgi:hypothetical protein